jgi:hypothetical protein
MSPNESNMELFNQLTVVLLTRLHDNFPVAQNIFIEDYEEFDSEEKQQVFFGTILFLTKENYIANTAQIFGGFLGVSLTSKGLTLLNEKPAAVSKSDSLVELFKDALKDGTAESFKTCVAVLTKAALALSMDKSKE